MPYTSIRFENTLAVITEEISDAYLRVRWKQAPWDLAEAQQAMNALLACMLRDGYRKVLIKQPPLRDFPLLYHTWLLYDWVPRALELGEVFYAIIPPQDLFAYIGVADLLLQLRRLGIRYFVATSREEGIAWLSRQSLPG